jgi:hypothetical protein
MLSHSCCREDPEAVQHVSLDFLAMGGSGRCVCPKAEKARIRARVGADYGAGGIVIFLSYDCDSQSSHHDQVYVIAVSGSDGKCQSSA